MNEPPAGITAHIALLKGYLEAAHPGMVGNCFTTAGEEGAG